MQPSGMQPSSLAAWSGRMEPEGHDATEQIQIIIELSMVFYTTYGNPIIYQCVRQITEFEETEQKAAARKLRG